MVGFISDFEEAVVRYAHDYDVDGVLCGHIHTAAIREIQGVAYYNAGDWVESCTAIVESYDGSMELLYLSEEAPPGDSSQFVSVKAEKQPTTLGNFGSQSGAVPRG